MNYLLQGHDRGNAVQDMLICLIPWQEHIQTAEETQGDLCITRLQEEQGVFSACASVRMGDRITEGRADEAVPCGEDAEERKRVATHVIKTALYRALLPQLPAQPVWGSLTGVKPAKPVRLLLESGMTEAEADAYLAQQYFVAESRREICMHAARQALDISRSLQPRETQLYIGIPFCPAKCSYCSFVSNDTKRSGHLIEPYLEALEQEIDAAGEMVAANSLVLGSVYIGGGTPTVLTAPQLQRLLQAVERAFGRIAVEFTVEAGRPETIDGEKLALLAAHGVSRISINPQSMDDSVLAGVGRLHTAEDIRRTFALARQTADFIINMDLIAGLPGDTAEGLIRSVEQVAALEPENITVHCLARKRGAPLWSREAGGLLPETLDTCYAHLAQKGYLPYYLYRQKYIAGGLENVGFCRGDTASRYNVCMMEELGDVIALGAGGVSKLCAESGRKVLRIANAKYPREYIAAAEEISRRKRQLSLIFA